MNSVLRSTLPFGASRAPTTVGVDAKCRREVAVRAQAPVDDVGLGLVKIVERQKICLGRHGCGDRQHEVAERTEDRLASDDHDGVFTECDSRCPTRRRNPSRFTTPQPVAARLVG